MSAAYDAAGPLVPCGDTFVRAIDVALVALSDALGAAVFGSLADAKASSIEQIGGAA